MANECRRKGTVWLKNKNGEVQIRTTCHTWGCAGCERKMISLFRLRVEAGVSQLGRCVFITLTYKLGEGGLKDAASVARDWKAFWRVLKRSRHVSRSMKWLRVVELTKKGMPHLHLVMGPTKGRVRCYGNGPFDAARFYSRMASCTCLSHEMARAWYKVTGDSFIVFVVPVVNARGAGAYLAKYLGKSLPVRKKLESLGFKRRWSTSLGWPGNGRLRLKEGNWIYHQYWPGWWPGLPEGAEPPSMLERTGALPLLTASENGTRRARVRKLEGMLNAENVREKE